MRVPAHERGAALFAVLALVALLAGFMMVGLAQARALAETAASVTARAQARALARSGVALAVAQLPVLRAQSLADPGVMTRARTLELPGGRVTLRFADGGNCLNINSVTQGEGEVSGTAPAAFARMLAAAGVAETDASRIARATAEWMDGGGVLRADASEWAGVPGVTPAILQAALPLLCALPTREPSVINLNAVRPDQAALLALLGIAPEAARRALARRPAAGYASPGEFWASATAGGEAPDNAGAAAAGTQPRWYALSVAAELGGERAAQTALIDAAAQPARVAASEWTR